MGFDNMPILAPLLMPGAADYAAECLHLGRAALASHRVEMDIPYGDDPFQALDVWMPQAAPAETLPVILFIHGGAMRNGFKEWIGAMAPTLCGLPAILVSPNYRLVPRVRNIDGLEDCLDALAWVHAHIAARGGDPARIYVGGHSAGGYLAALMAVRPAELRRKGLDPAILHGCLPVSGIFTMERKDFLAEDSMRRRFWSEMVASDAEAAEMTVFNHIADTRMPFLIAYGADEPANIIADNLRLIDAACAGGFLRDSMVFPGCDHFRAHMACTDPDGPWLRAVRALLAEGAR